MTKKTNALTRGQIEKTLLLGIHAPYNRTEDPTYYFQEFINLAKTNNLPIETTLFMRLRSIDSAYFITKGKLDELRTFCQEQNIEQIVISEQLTAQQERNLTDFLDCPVFDRTMLILEIFEKAAFSAEGKTQVEMALLRYKKSRLAGKGIGMSQQQGGFGMIGGYGETAKEKETRHIEKTLLKLRKELDHIQTIRDTQRKQRLNNKVPQVCLIGYTNAGKSTVLNALTHSEVLAEDKLFATLDTTTRELYLEGKKKGVISDTVGFIQQLPHTLIEAFKSTLSELQYADLLVQVVDISDPSWELHIKVTLETLQDLGVCKQMLYVFNKSDKITEGRVPAAIERYQPHVIISCLSKEGIQPLKDFLTSWTCNK